MTRVYTELRLTSNTCTANNVSLSHTHSLSLGVQAQKCQVPPGTSFDRLFVDGLRRTQARYPNGDMLVPKVMCVSE